VWVIRVIRVICGFYVIRGFGYWFFCGYKFRRVFRDGSVIITSVAFDRMRTLHFAFLSFALLLPV
jgi:hypothetical protein